MSLSKENNYGIPTDEQKKLDEIDMLKVVNCLSKEYLEALPIKPIREPRYQKLPKK